MGGEFAHQLDQEDGAADGGPQDPAELGPEDVLPLETEPDRPHPHDRVRLVAIQDLVKVLLSP